MNKITLIILLLGLTTIRLATIAGDLLKNRQGEAVENINTPTPTVITASPTPIVKVPIKKVGIDELNKIYGPCTNLKVLMYHHIEDDKISVEKEQKYLSVSPEVFRQHMEYLKVKGYTSISPENLINFFDNGVALPNNPVLITLNDAYKDNYIHAFPILKEYGFKATIFAPTGLVQNPEYLSWPEIKEMSESGLIYFGNHTWSHHSSTGTPEVLKKEIGIADTQLAENGQNSYKIFAYPYGNSGKEAKKVLEDMGYKLGFTTVNGQTMCKGQRLELPRIRVRNEPRLNLGL